MPSGKHQLDIDIPIERMWDFVSDMDNWAPLVPGYIDHEKMNGRQSKWKFKGDTGIIRKTVSLRIDITEWKEPTTVAFNLTGLTENFVGSGYFQAEKKKHSTSMTGCLQITAKGLAGPMVNSVLKSYVPKTTKEFTKAVAEKMTEGRRVTN
ncbi:CoxG family protein [Virgibacillus kekensis]|uniref:CoxG family protein n=1 Tax=Virgibacillus kekensis TaxID=202261 RepID=A0ABV9DHH7_9BACI